MAHSTTQKFQNLKNDLMRPITTWTTPSSANSSKNNSTKKNGSFTMTGSEKRSVLAAYTKARTLFVQAARRSRSHGSGANFSSSFSLPIALGVACGILGIAVATLASIPTAEAQDEDSKNNSDNSSDANALDILNDALAEGDFEERNSEDKQQRDEEVQREVNNWWDLLSEELPIFIAAIVLALTSALVGLSLPKLGGSVIDLTKQGSTADLIRVALKLAGTLGLYVAIVSVVYGAPCILGLILFCCSCSQAFLHFLFYSLLSVGAERMVARLRRRLYEKMISQDREFFDHHNSGELMSRLSGDIVEIRTAVKHAISMGIRSTSQLVGGVVGMFMLSPKLTSVICVVVALTVSIGSIYARWLRRLSRESNDLNAKASSVGQESLANVNTVQAFCAEKREVERYSSLADRAAYLAQKFGIAIGAFQGLSIVALNGTVLGVLCLGGHLVGSSELTTGDLTSFVATAYSVQSALGQISILGSQLMRGVGAAERIFEILNQVPKINSSKGYTLDRVRGDIALHRVSFRYPNRKHVKVLDEVSLDLKAGRVLSLVGASGSGKTTISKLILRQYDTEAGSVTLDGVDIRTLDPHWLRDQIGIVDQEPTLFHGTIAENISYGKPTASRWEVENAASSANCHDFVRQFPDGYDTVVGERGVQLSGGQRQRIAIARALLKNPRILILDEATSALDSESEKLVQAALNRLMQDRTVLIIAHRLSTIKNSDVILVVDKGRIVEAGSHNDLIKKNGSYANLVRKQYQDEPSAEPRA
jgi:ATP-binding cassette, subfamily B (MDR/TAP), member 8